MHINKFKKDNNANSKCGNRDRNRNSKNNKSWDKKSNKIGNNKDRKQENKYSKISCKSKMLLSKEHHLIEVTIMYSNINQTKQIKQIK